MYSPVAAVKHEQLVPDILHFQIRPPLWQAAFHAISLLSIRKKRHILTYLL